MSKSIYDEVLDILLDSFKDPQDEDNDCFIFNFRQIVKIEKALLQARDQEKLLELYRKLTTVKDELISLAWFDDECDETEEIETDLEKQIKELENE